MKRKTSDWINGYVELLAETEWPIPFVIWSAISCVAGALQRRVWMPWGPDKIYPNLFIILVGHSGLGKGQAMKAGIEMFRSTGLPVTADAVTLADLLNFLDAKAGSFEYPPGSGIIQQQAAAQIFARELTVLLGTKDMKKLAHLTDLYDCHDHWKNATKSQGVDELWGVCVNILGATAPDWFPTILPVEAMGGGFSSRIIFVVEQTGRKAPTRPPWTAKHEKLRDDLQDDLHTMATYYIGPYEFDKEAFGLFDSFYQKQQENIRNDLWPVPDKMFQGYCTRRALHLRKVAMSMAISRGSMGDINAADFERAYKILENAESKMPRTFGGVGRSLQGAITNDIINYLLSVAAKGRTPKRSDVLRLFIQDIDDRTLQLIETTLSRIGFMKVSVKQNGDAEYAINVNWET